MAVMIITGGAGFIGSNFVRFIMKNSDLSVVVVDKLTYAGSQLNLLDFENDSRFEFQNLDIADSERIRQLFDKKKPRYILNFAAESHVDRSIDNPREFVQTNVCGTVNLLGEALRLYRALDKSSQNDFRFLHISTDEVYGSLGRDGLFSETTPYAPNSPYAASKASADHFVRAYQETYGLPCLITNCSNNYGPYQFPEKLIPLVILNALEGKDIPIYGDGGNIRDWLYVEDHCEGIWRVLQKGGRGEKYNIGGGHEVSNLELIDSILKVLEGIVPAKQNQGLQSRGFKSYGELKTFVDDRPGHDRRYAIDASKIKKELGWSAGHSFKSAIEATVNWYVNHRDWCQAIEENNYKRERLGLSSAKQAEPKGT